MMMGTLSLVQKGQTRGCNEHSMQWTQYAVPRGIVVCGVGDIVFGGKRSNQRMLWTEYAVDAVRRGIVVCGGGDIVFGAKRSNQWMQYAVDTVE